VDSPHATTTHGAFTAGERVNIRQIKETKYVATLYCYEMRPSAYMNSASGATALRRSTNALLLLLLTILAYFEILSKVHFYSDWCRKRTRWIN